MSSGRCSPSRAAIVVTVVTLGLVTTAVVVHKLSKANQEEDPAQSGAWYDPLWPVGLASSIKPPTLEMDGVSSDAEGYRGWWTCTSLVPVMWP